MFVFELSWQKWLLYSVIAIIVFIIVRRIFKHYHVKLFVRFIDNLAFNYEVRMKQRKITLFGRLRELQEKLGRPLKVVEIGAGSGANFVHYPDSTSVTCIDPEPEFDSYMEKKIRNYPNISVKKQFGFAEDMSAIESNSIDAVVSTLVLCTVRDVNLSLKEVHRILRPGGYYLFMEHVIAEQSIWIKTVQFLLDLYLWPWLIMGCNLTRSTWENIKATGFSHVELEKFMANELLQPTPIFLGVSLLVPHIAGIATK